jgi:hypothetical protein
MEWNVALVRIAARAGSGFDAAARRWRRIPASTSAAEIAVLSRVILAAVLLSGATGATAAMSECQAGCEKTYKYCAANKKSSESVCKTEYEKCRKQCAKKQGKPSPA